MKKLITFATLLLTASMGQVAMATNHGIGDKITVSGTTYYVASTNLITNGSFESGFKGWTSSNNFSTTITSEKFALKTDEARDGNNYLVGTTNEGRSGSGSLGTAWEIEAGKTYYFTYWVKGLADETDGQWLITSMTDSPSNAEESAILGYPTTVSSEWMQVEYKCTNSSDYNRYLQVNFRWLDSQWGFDDFQLYEIQEAEIGDLPDDDEYHTDDEYADGVCNYTVVSDNLFANGSFNSEVESWTAGGYTTPAVIDSFAVLSNGGYNDGAYLITHADGAASGHTISQAIPVEVGAFYLFIGYTKGDAPTSDNLRYNALFEMNDDGTKELDHEEDDGKTYSDEIVRLTWGDGTAWTKTESVFFATTPYVGMRMGWNSNSHFDGFQLYKLEVVVPEDASPENPVDLTDLIANPDASDYSYNGWTCSSSIIRSGGQHWSGDGSRQYFEPNHWNDSGIFEESISQVITLPYDGVYRLTAAGRASDGTTTTLFADNMEYTFPSDADTGGTIATDGTEWESVEAGLAAGKSFAHDNAGYGWNWGSVEIVASVGKLEIGARFDETLSSASHKWASIVDFKLEYLGSSLEALKDALTTDIADAEAIDVTTNVGTEAFKHPQDLADALTAAIEDAKTALNDASATEESLTVALTALRTAVHDFDNAELNKPAEGETYSIILSQEGGVYDGGAVTSVYSSSNSSSGYYRFYFYHGDDKVADWNRNYAPQNYTFTPDDSKLNGYTISFVGEDGNTHYLCLGTVYSGDSKQVRATTTESSAFVFQVVVTSTDGIWKLYNSSQGQNTGNGSNDGGLYTSESGQYSDLQLVSNAIPVNITEAGWTTLVLPYDAELPSTDLTAYTIAGQSTSQDNAVTLTKVTDGKLTARQPYLINGTEVKEYAINGTSTVFDLSTAPSDSYLVGTWEYIPSVTTGNYVLQYQPDVDGTAFYIVDGTQGDITLAMNRCYLLGTSVSTANAPYFSLSMNDDTATAIEAVAEETAETGDGAIYDLGGRRVSKAQKGIYIKDGKKVIIK